MLGDKPFMKVKGKHDEAHGGIVVAREDELESSHGAADGKTVV